MDLSALVLSRLQFAFTLSFHVIFPSFTIGLAAWLTVLEALYLATGLPAYRTVFEFWLKIFGIAFGLGVVSGIVMAFELGTNWSEFSRVSGPIQGPLLAYENFTAFALEASFFRVLLFGRQRVAPWFYLLSTAMVALGTTFSAFWIMVNNSWMQAPVGYAIENGAFVPTDWSKIVFSPVAWVRFPHMLLASYLTGAFCVAATSAWYLLRRKFHIEARIMLRMGLYLAAILIPAQLFFGHLTGDFVHDYQVRRDRRALARRAAGERGPHGHPRSRIGDEPVRRQRSGSGQPDRKLELHLERDRLDRLSAPGPSPRGPPVLRVPRHGRLWHDHAAPRMDWNYLSVKNRIEQNRALLYCIFLSF